ncbi:8-oxo-dGTP diphosphatase [Haloactinopolyspora alba]|uniref:8-oxo-dGTP diphosphatase n=1 Tax=Haloactinopolyspora alba TaxID=648780 RepID=A0A2P8DK15_9ACTN|nr:NUDIX domain-containing protein [Haloactinopolyspora alba]PSK97563.1 8-oxo-dGTP diphosphatase [Haloactinopolyspora alba]
MTGTDGPVLAAGAVVWAGPLDRPRVCLIHRPKYDDWSLPKGKADRDEHLFVTAVREVAEETGHDVVLGRPLPSQEYDVAGRPKLVRYWLAEADPDPRPREPDAEVDDVVFLPLPEALDRLSHPHDVDLVEAAMSGPLRTTATVLLRHAKAVSRSSWDGPDAERPLTADGSAHAEALAAPLSTLGLRRVVSSDAVRCVDSVRPFARQRSTMELEPLLSEHNLDAPADPHPATKITRSLGREGGALICSHRPVLPLLFDALGVERPPALGTGSFAVVHHDGDRLVAVDRPDAP